MLKITLYQNCILNENYFEVFSKGKKTGETYSVLDTYLNSLSNIILTVNDAYYENTGELVIDYDLFISQSVKKDIYNFNYMKIEMYDDENTSQLLISRYCFVNSIAVKNGCVYLDYKEDSWSSYSDKISGITSSYLSRSRFHDYPNITIPIKKLPTEYQSDKPLLFSQLNNANSYDIYLEIQYYLLSVQGEPENRYTRIYKVFLPSSEITHTWNYIGYYIQDIINRITKDFVSPIAPNEIEATDPQFRFEVGEIYVVPSYISFNLTQPSSDDLYLYSVGDSGFDAHYHFRVVDFTQPKTVTFTINNNYKNRKIGTFNHSIDITNLGRNCQLKLITFASETDLGIYINYQGQFLDITEDFKYNMPYQSLRSAEVIQDKMTHAIKLGERNTHAEDVVWEHTKELVKFQISTLLSRFVYSAQILSEFYNEKGLEQAKLKEVNEPMYTYSTANFSNSQEFMNSYYGICVFYIDSVNDDYVKEFINRNGYEVYNFINNWSNLETENVDLFITTRECKYNVLKFDVANVYGAFPRDIADTLNLILETGVKIWYDSAMSSDTYVV